jgi:hypothetical protein
MKLLSTFFIFILLSISFSFAESCNIHFEDVGNDTDKIINLVESFDEDISTEVLDKILNMSVHQRKQLIETIGSYDTEQFGITLRNLKENPDHYNRFNQFDPNKFTLDVIKPNHAKRSFESAKEWSFGGEVSQYRFPMEFISDHVPTKLDKKYLKTYVAINSFFNDVKLVHERMQAFEDVIMLNSLKDKPNFYSLSEKKQAEIIEKNIVKELNGKEVEHGFKSASRTDDYKAFELKDMEYSLDEWMKMLEDGKIFNDPTFKSVENASELTVSKRNGHGYYTHRIQWHILMKDMDSRPSRYKGFTGVEIFKKLGDTKFDKSFGNGTNSRNTSWQRLFDSLNGGYQEPETFRQLHTDYPDLGAWL